MTHISTLKSEIWNRRSGLSTDKTGRYEAVASIVAIMSGGVKRTRFCCLPKTGASGNEEERNVDSLDHNAHRDVPGSRLRDIFISSVIALLFLKKGS